MLTSETFSNCLEYLFPCTGLIYVGAGNGAVLNGERFSRISSLLAIEADDLAFSHLATVLQSHAGWVALKALVDEDEAETTYFVASNPNESGLLNPDALKAVWRNLACREVRLQPSITLSSVLRNDLQAKRYNWLSIDCLPSARVLRGLEDQFNQFDVIDVRVLDFAAGILEQGCTKVECDTLLTPLGYQSVFVGEAANPLVQSVVYVRDRRASFEIQTERIKQHYLSEIEQLTQARVAAEKLAAERAQHVEQATKAKYEQARLAQERQAQIEQLKQARLDADDQARAALQSEQQARAKEKTDLLKALQDKLAHEHAWLAHSCIISDDSHQSVQKIIVNYKLAQTDLFDFLVELSDQIIQSGDKVTALSYLNKARKAIAAPSKEILTTFVTRLINLGQENEAEAVFTQAALDGIGVLPLSDNDKAVIKKANQSIHRIIGQRSEHGHDLLLSAFNKYLPKITPQINGRKPVLIEIGTTREEVRGQGSTRKLADYCKNHDLEFITVDMDPHNGDIARQMFLEMDTGGFQAITMKGEDYLRAYTSTMDFVFLDAYDFDHGEHSELRQSRYQKFLGSRIDETECHRMHLDCAQSLAQKLSPFGFVCVDDTWMEDGRWSAKGTLAMPYLLANGFELVEARNRAALLRRKSEAAARLEV
jgi:hypothetical protein